MSYHFRKHLPTIVLIALSFLTFTSCHSGLESRGFAFVWPKEVRDSMNYTMAFQLDKPLPDSKLFCRYVLQTRIWCFKMTR